MKSVQPKAKYYGEKQEKSLWESICDEFDAKRRHLEQEDVDDSSSVATNITQFSSTKHSPVVYGHMVHHTAVDANFGTDFDPAIGHPASIGLSLLSRPLRQQTPPPPTPPDPKLCDPTQYLESYVFPVLMPALAEMLKEAGLRKCFEKRLFGFNACDFLTEYLYRENHNLTDREKLNRKSTDLYNIPFVVEWTLEHPRPPLPLSLVWTEEEAAVKIQSFYRGHLVRLRPDVAELRQWQKDWREDNGDIREKVEKFWVAAETRVSEAGGRSTRMSTSTGRRSMSSLERESTGNRSISSMEREPTPTDRRATVPLLKREPTPTDRRATVPFLKRDVTPTDRRATMPSLVREPAGRRSVSPLEREPAAVEEENFED